MRGLTKSRKYEWKGRGREKMSVLANMVIIDKDEIKKMMKNMRILWECRRLNGELTQITKPTK